MLITLIAFIFVLGLLVLVHELGHFFVARKCRVKVEEFGLGLPPRIFGYQSLVTKKLEPIITQENIEVAINQYSAGESNTVIQETITDKIKEIDQVVTTKKWRLILGRKDPADNLGGTIYSLNWIPLGGFVKIKGESGEAATDPDSFVNKNVWQRIAIIAAGVFMNLVLAAFLLSIGLTIGLPQVMDDKPLPALAAVQAEKIIIINVLADSPAQKAALAAGDVIISLDGQLFNNITALQEYVNGKVGYEVQVTVDREGKQVSQLIKPEIISETQRGGFGVGLVETAVVSYPWYIAWWYGIIETGKLIWAVISGFYLVLKSLIFSHHLIADVYGPVGIADLVGQAAKMGFIYLLQFTASLSIIIAVMNFLPFPALDGGRIFFLLVEAVRRKAINQRIEAVIHNVGFLLLMALVVLVTFRDIGRVSGGFFSNLFGGITRLF